MRHMSRSWATAAAWVCAAVPAFAADSTVRGRVVDALTARPIPGVAITLSGRAEVARQATTNDAGDFVLTGVEPGRFFLTAEARGYRRAVQDEVRTLERDIYVANFALLPLGGAASASDALEEVVVTAQAISVDPFAGVSTAVLDREEIRRSAGTAGDVFRGLDILPGVSATGEYSSFSVRGNGLRDNLILVDDIPFDKVVHFNSSFGDQDDVGGGGRFSIFAPNLIGSAEFQPGAWRASEGGKNGSLLRLEVAEPSGAQSIASAQLDVAGPELGYEGPSGFHEGTNVLFSARKLDFERLFKAIDNEDVGAPSLTDVILKSVTEINDAHALEFLAIYAPEEFERDVDNVLASENFEDVTLTRTEQDSALFGATWRWLVGESTQIRNVLYLRDSDKDSSQGEAYPDLAPPGAAAADIPLRENILTVSEAEREIGWRSDVSIVESGGNVLTFGTRITRVSLDFQTALAGDWLRYVYDQTDFRPDPQQRYIVLTPERFDSSFDAEETRAAAYVDYAWRLARLTITPGLRYDYDGFSRESLVSPRLSLSWQQDPATRVWVGAGTFYQAPRYFDLAANPANGDLENEKSTQVSLGAERYLRDDVRLSAEIYYQDLDELVVIPDRTSGVAANAGSGENAGFDLSLWKRMTEDWSASFGYSYLNATRDDADGRGEYDADQDRPHLVTIGGAWEPNDNWAFSAKWKYASGRPTYDFVVYADVLGDPDLVRFSKELTTRNTRRYPDYHVLNLRVDYRRRLGPLSLIAFLDVINAYGRDNIDSRDWDERRGIETGDGFGVFPNIGLKFEYVWTPGS